MNQKSARTLLTPAVAQSVSKQGREYRVTGGGWWWWWWWWCDHTLLLHTCEVQSSQQHGPNTFQLINCPLVMLPPRLTPFVHTVVHIFQLFCRNISINFL